MTGRLDQNEAAACRREVACCGNAGRSSSDNDDVGFTRWRSQAGGRTRGKRGGSGHKCTAAQSRHGFQLFSPAGRLPEVRMASKSHAYPMNQIATNIA
jgi:hypothetical protein